MNWRRTSFTICEAARATARIVSDENNSGTAPPINSPMNTIGEATLIPVSTGWLSWAWTLPTSVRYEPNSATAAITAEPIAMPLVTAFVVLPTASRSSITLRAFLSSPAISPIPLALSEIGPNESIEIVLPVSVSIPMPVSETP